MYRLKHGIKRDPQRRWRLPDRIFFGYGACHILAGVFLERPPLPGFFAERIVPAEGFAGSHAYVTDGTVAFDFHGYSPRAGLLVHHARAWQGAAPGWRAEIRVVDFPLLDTGELNARKMLGPDQYYGDPCARAAAFLARFDHPRAAVRAADDARMIDPQRAAG